MDAAYVAFTKALEDGINAGDASALDANVDMERLIERSTRDISAPAHIAEAFKAKRRSGVTMGKQLVDARNEEFDFHLLRLRMDGGAPHALYRVISKGGFNYLDFELARNARGKVVIVDFYPYISGELFSETLRRMYLMAATEAGHNLVDKLMGKEQEFLENLPKLGAMQRLTQERKPAEVVKTFGELPPSLRQNKLFLRLRLNAASNLEESEYQKAIEDYEKALPNDPSLALISIAGHILRKDYAGVMRSIDRLDQRVKDPYLQYIRGGVMLKKGDGKEARRFFQAAIDAEPTLESPYWEQIGLSLQDKKYKDTARYLTAIERDAGVKLGELTDLEQYAGFVKSPEYKAWNKQRGARQQAAPAVP